MTNQELINATLADKSEIELRDIAAELQKALAKSDRVGIAIFYAELTLDWLDSELSRGQR